ncbi:MAG: hypothetical protein KGJ31_02775 [Patescibacteria group bacterium]|nr:hypothetical protein [Patescibacteria group bacterium]
MRQKILILALILFLPVAVHAQTIAPQGPLVLRILSSKTLSGTAGDFVDVKGSITNTSGQAVQGITTYLSLSDNQTHKPVDLEDWSAEKGLYVGTIDAGATFPLDWKIHFVTAGDYSLIIVAETIGNPLPQVSEITQFHVAPKKNLDPAQVLPVALGVPILLIFALFLLAYRRKVDE